ncbi:L10-interacting MYB domain-containing protein-like isoform X1 [Juglans regia]|uniref:L10-interacting MYB domain-containing protein-like isoform X1 n=3 Tax=Juglans regia TaxID=51240 RepID=A0A2I4EM27_JUGRE|nr:L10-interacting MYB domain-containing protein-like isoform X1 [Juglans regia]
MMDSEVGHNPKQERSRTRWTASLDKIFADLVVRQIQLGNRPNNVFDKKTWNIIREDFNEQTDLNFNNNQLRKHLDVLRTRFHNLKSVLYQNNDFALDDSCCIGFDLWENIGAQTRPEMIRVKDCPIYEQLCAIFIDSAAEGKYAQSSHYEELEKSAGMDSAGLISCQDGGIPCSTNPSSSLIHVQGNMSAEKVIKNIAQRKRKGPSETHSLLGQEIYDTMAEALSEMVASLKSRAVVNTSSDDRFSITNCIRALDEIQDIEERLYFAALDLFEDPSLRETFISLKGEKIRLAWLQGKRGKATVSLHDFWLSGEM